MTIDPISKVLVLFIAIVVLAVACGGGDAVETGASPTAPASTNSGGTLPPATARPGTTRGTTPPGTEPSPSIAPVTEASTTAAPATPSPATTPRPVVTRPVTPTISVPPTVPATNPPVAPLPPGPNSVFVMGDSVLSGTYTTIPAALSGWNVTMDAVGSRRLTQAIPILQQRRGEIGRVLVIQMGNNHIAGEGGSFASQIDQAMQSVEGVDRVVWITVAEVNGPARVAINNDIRAAADRWPTIVVAEWAPLVAAHPEYAPGDALHLSAQGRVEMANLVASAVGPPP